MASQHGSIRRITGSVLIVLGSVVLIGSSAAKFAHVPPVVQQLAKVGFSNDRLMIIAVLEIVSAILFLIPLTRDIGLLLVSAYFGGAIATHMGHSEPVIQPAIILAIFWAGTFLRHREALWSHSELFARRDASRNVISIHQTAA
jgi:hypothetical protein